MIKRGERLRQQIKWKVFNPNNKKFSDYRVGEIHLRKDDNQIAFMLCVCGKDKRIFGIRKDRIKLREPLSLGYRRGLVVVTIEGSCLFDHGDGTAPCHFWVENGILRFEANSGHLERPPTP